MGELAPFFKSFMGGLDRLGRLGFGHHGVGVQDFFGGGVYRLDLGHSVLLYVLLGQHRLPAARSITEP